MYRTIKMHVQIECKTLETFTHVLSGEWIIDAKIESRLKKLGASQRNQYVALTATGYHSLHKVIYDSVY